MKTPLLLALAAFSALAITACDNGLKDEPARNSTNGSSAPSTPRPTAPTETRPVTPTPTTPPAPTNADNTDRNKQDRDMDAKTPMDQSNTPADINITAEIRRAIMDDKAMSTNGQNCKIITQAGAVTLRGPVDSQTEKDAIEAKARAVAGVTNVTNELEVKAS